MDAETSASSTPTRLDTFTSSAGTDLTADATFYTDGTDGILTYTTQSGDLNICGKWRIQWYVTFSVGSWKTDIKTFKVYDNLT